MTQILIPKYAEIVLPDSARVRPDSQDCNDYVEEITAQLQCAGAESLASGRVITHDPSSVAAGYGEAGVDWANKRPQTWVNNGPQTGDECPQSFRDGGTPQPDCPPSRTCGNVPLPIHTIGKSGYPLVGTALGTLTVGNAVTYTSGRAGLYHPKRLFFRALDQLNGFAEVEGFMVLPKVSGNPQMPGSDANIDGSIPSAVCSGGYGPFLLDDWRAFGNTSPEVLSAAWGHMYANSTSATFVGLLFGDATGLQH